ncbi:MAG: hypothetical protein EHM20_12705 [Alphaproteobacteria bacterium]|nr:MAG: hypothetical protein EHM20_12705 [Alphaproteobacteria bacterium]
MRHLKIYSLFLLLFFSVSCGNYSKITIGQINGVVIKGFEGNALIVSVRVPVDNPTRHKITISDFDTKIFMNNQYLGKMILSDPLVLKAKSDQVYDLLMEIRLANLFGTALNIMNLKSGQIVLFRLEGTVQSRSLLLRRKIEINESREVII